MLNLNLNQLFLKLNKKRNLLIYLTFSLSWIIIYSRDIITPWIDGTDANTRLFHIDQTLVYVRGNPWLPGLQLLLQVVHTLSDSAVAYKLLIAIFSFSAMLLVFHLLLINTHIIVASVWAISMFYSKKWAQVSTSLYMETPCLFFCLLAYFYALKSRKHICFSCLIVASFFRPEILLMSPLVGVYLSITTKNIKLTAIYFLSMIPCALFYLYIKFSTPHFVIPESYDIKIAYNLASKLAYEIINSRLHQGCFLLAILSFFALLFDKNFLEVKRKSLLLFILFIFAFYLEFIFILPALHSFSIGGTRPSLLVTGPMSVYAGIGAYYIYLKLPKFFKIIFYSLVLFSLVNLYLTTQPTQNLVYEASVKINNLLALENKKPDLDYCVFNNNNEKVHPTKYMPVIVHLRFLGWKPLLKSCDLQDQNNIILKFYKGKINDNEIKSCTQRVNIDTYAKVLGEVCLY